MDLQPPPSGPLSPHEALQQAIARTVFGVCAITCLAGVATVGLFVAERPAQVRHAMVGLYLLLATACKDSTMRPVSSKGRAGGGATGARRSIGMMKAPQQDMACS